jgi:hypothetical protein
MGKAPIHKNKGKRGHKLSHKAARRTKSDLAPPDLMWNAFHSQSVKVGVRSCVWSAAAAPARECAHVLCSAAPPQSEPPPLDEDLPGMGQFYCNVTGCASWPTRASAATERRRLSLGPARTRRWCGDEECARLTLALACAHHTGDTSRAPWRSRAT